MTDEINVQSKEKIDQKETVNNVQVENVPSAAMVVNPQRPTFLSILCILTYIGSGLYILGALITTVLSGVLEAIGTQIPSELSMLIPDTGLFAGIIILLAAVASLVGAIKMWKLQKIGFTIYAIAQVVMLVAAFGVMSLIFTGLFIGLYFMNLKHMK